MSNKTKAIANTKETKQVQIKDDVLKKLEKATTTSAKIRYLDSLGYTKGNIAKTLKIRFQHVRNVLVTPITKAKETIK